VNTHSFSCAFVSGARLGLLPGRWVLGRRWVGVKSHSFSCAFFSALKLGSTQRLRQGPTFLDNPCSHRPRLCFCRGASVGAAVSICQRLRVGTSLAVRLLSASPPTRESKTSPSGIYRRRKMAENVNEPQKVRRCTAASAIRPTRGGPTPSTPIAIGCRACSGSATARSLPFYPLDCSPVGRRRRRKTSTRRATRTSFRAWRRFCRRSMPRTPPAALFWRRSSPTRWRCASITICRSVSMLAPASCRRRSHLHS